MSEDIDFTLIDPTTFHNKKFSVDSFLVSLTKDVISPGNNRTASFGAGKDALSANEQVQRVQRLLGVLERCAPQPTRIVVHMCRSLSQCGVQPHPLCSYTSNMHTPPPPKTYAHARTRARARTHTHTHPHTHPPPPPHARTHTRTHTRARTRIHTHTHTCTHTHTRTHTRQGRGGGVDAVPAVHAPGAGAAGYRQQR
mgnify:CR=1 FL=1